MEKINKFRWILFGIAFIHINLITTGIVFSPFGFLNDLVIMGNFMFLILNALILGFSFASQEFLKNNSNRVFAL